jgi:putative oxidoreductase
MASFHERMAEFFKSYGLLFGRLALLVIFVHSGISQIRGFSGTIGYMKSKMGSLSDPMLEFVLVLALIVSFAGSLMIALGWQARMGAMLLFIFLLIVTPIFHNFWAAPADAHQLQLIQFEKNVAIMGGLWVLMAAGAGPFSIDKPKPKPDGSEEG